MRIPYEDIKHHLPPEGWQVKVNHTNCPAGTDTKQRLYIKRENGNILAYCHNCGYHRVHRSGTKGLRSVEQTWLCAPKELPTSLTLPHDVEVDPQKWPATAAAWMYQYRLDDALIMKHGLTYSPSLGRVIIPVYDEDGVLIFWQGRRIEGAGPKYLSVKSAKKPVFFAKSAAHAYSPCAVVVEDVLSAIRVGETGMDAYALLGTSEPDSLFERLDKYKKCLVWLDPDVAGRRKANDVANRIALNTHAETKLVLCDKEPKQLDHTVLCTILLDEFATMT